MPAAATEAATGGVGSKGAQRRREQAGSCEPSASRPWLGDIRFDGIKVRDGKSSDAAVVRTLNEGHRVLVAERSKSARITIPSKGWVKLQKHSEPVLQQEACDVRKPGQESATTQVTNSVLQRLGVMMPKPEEERLMLALYLMQVLTDCSTGPFVISRSWRLSVHRFLYFSPKTLGSQC
ncbi:unnamed protein product [Symbiodinium sp. CCMP2456]|nr:unnamed protein product [Symbiodinium sp. CCMP2456]